MYTDTTFKGLKINCNKKKPTNQKILESLYVMTFTSANELKRPIGCHIRTRLSKKMSATEFSSRLSTYFRRKSGYLPLRISVLENDPLQGGQHYHHALIIDNKHDTYLSIHYFLADLRKRGFLHDYSIQKHKDAPHGLNLTEDYNKEKFFYWLSYIAKTRTKKENSQIYSASRKISKDVRSWRESKSPKLTKNPKPTTLEDFLRD